MAGCWDILIRLSGTGSRNRIFFWRLADDWGPTGELLEIELLNESGRLCTGMHLIMVPDLMEVTEEMKSSRRDFLDGPALD